MTDSADPSSVETFDYRRAALENAFVSLTGLGDGDMVSEGFTLNRRMDVRVYAVGEGTDRRMYDYGWIVDASTRETVWTMDLYETEHAGGAAKNRMADEIITLEPGNYIVYYATDDSHSAYEWFVLLALGAVQMAETRLAVSTDRTTAALTVVINTPLNSNKEAAETIGRKKMR